MESYSSKKKSDDVVRAISQSCESLSEPAANVDLKLNSRAWNDKKVGAHHAIIPTVKKADISRLSRAEAQIYELVARQYLAQFYPPYIYLEVKVAARIKGNLFTAVTKNALEMGWKKLFPKRDEKSGAEFSKHTIPTLMKGDVIKCAKAHVRDKLTQAPLPFNDASLLAAMTGISRFVKDQEIRKDLRDTDGLGTEATRSGIIELLFKREFLSRKGKSIISTDAGKALIACLPDSASLPDMTAQWECHLSQLVSEKPAMPVLCSPWKCYLSRWLVWGPVLMLVLFKGLNQRRRAEERSRPEGSGGAPVPGTVCLLNSLAKLVSE